MTTTLFTNISWVEVEGEGQSQRSFDIDATLLFAFNLRFSFSQGYQRVLLITPIIVPSLFTLSQFIQIAQSFSVLWSCNYGRAGVRGGNHDIVLYSPIFD